MAILGRDHPWSGESGYIEFENGTTTITRILGGPPMVLVVLHGHNGQTCYAEQKDLGLIREEVIEP